ncbi:MAG TPA: hypothetical protein VKA57_07400 [Solirubrobacteraceae bacterium]|nr:hypothetical protein [Solirubrobacteraceae bacterium]
MTRRTGAVAVVLASTLLIAAAPLEAKNPKPKPKAGGGNSSAAHSCNHGGYRSLVGADGTTFKNTGACVRFRARGGVFAEGIIIPAGRIATLSNARWTLGPCDALTYGYQLNLGTNVPLASKPGGVCMNATLPGATVGPFRTATLLRIFLTDTGIPPGVNCNYTFYSDGSHALVTGTNPYTVDIRDSVFCAVPPTVPLVPAGVGLGNVSVTVTIA